MRENLELTRKIRKGSMIKVVWRDAVEGPGGASLVDLETSILREIVGSRVVTTGRYLGLIGSHLVLSEVLREDSATSLLYETRAEGKWLSIPIETVSHITPLKNIDPIIAREGKRRRTICKQLRFIPRSKRLANGQIGRMLYVT